MCIIALQVGEAKQQAKGKCVPSVSWWGYWGTDPDPGEGPTSSPPCKTYTVVNQLCEGTVGGPATPFFLQLWYWSQEVVESAGTPRALSGTVIFQLDIPLLNSVRSCSCVIRSQPVRHRGWACDTSFQVFVLKRVNKDRLQHLSSKGFKNALKIRCQCKRLISSAVLFSGQDTGMQLLLVALPACCLKFAGFPGPKFYLASPVSGLTLNWEISVT